MKDYFLKLSFITIFVLAGPTVRVGADTFFGERATGLTKLEEYRYPVYLYVPEYSEPTRSLPLIISLPDDGEDPKKHAESWALFAKQNNLIVLTPEIRLRYTDVSYQTDSWLTGIKRNVVKRYQVAESKIFLIGTGSNAHYAAYLGAKYPKEFSAVALLGGSWVGPLEGLIPIESRPGKQLPFFVSLIKESEATISTAEKKAAELTRDGYPVYFEVLEKKQTFIIPNFRQRMIAWLDEKSQSRQITVAESQKSLK